MYAKVFEQIFDSSISENYTLRHFFMDMLVLSDSEGVVDKTPEAIARRTNIPMDIVNDCLNKLSSPDPSSRTPTEDGRRLIPLSPDRSWGWVIVNYELYRDMRDEEARKSYHRNYMREKRESKRLLSSVKSCEGLLTHTDTDIHTHTTINKKKEAAVLNVSYSIPINLADKEFMDAWNDWLIHRKELKKSLTKSTANKQLDALSKMGLKKAVESIHNSILKGWMGLFEPKESNSKPNKKDRPI